MSDSYRVQAWQISELLLEIVMVNVYLAVIAVAIWHVFFDGAPGSIFSVPGAPTTTW